MKSANQATFAQQRRRFLVQGSALTLAAAASGLLVSLEGDRAIGPDRTMPQGEPASPAAAADLAALARSGHPVPVEHFFSSPENFAQFLELTGNA